MDSIKLFKVLSDKSRINIILSLKEEDMVVKSKKDQYYKVYTLQKSFLSKTLEELLTLKEDPQVTLFGKIFYFSIIVLFVGGFLLMLVKLMLVKMQTALIKDNLRLKQKNDTIK